MVSSPFAGVSDACRPGVRVQTTNLIRSEVVRDTAGPAGSTTDLTDSLTRRRVASPHDRRVASLLRPSRASDARVCRVEETSPLAAAPSRVARLYLERAALLRRRRRRASSRYAFLRLGDRATARRPVPLLRPVREASLGVLSRDRGGCRALLSRCLWAHLSHEPRRARPRSCGLRCRL